LLRILGRFCSKPRKVSIWRRHCRWLLQLLIVSADFRKQASLAREAKKEKASAANTIASNNNDNDNNDNDNDNDDDDNANDNDNEDATAEAEDD
jgi:hypothetical protein